MPHRRPTMVSNCIMKKRAKAFRLSSSTNLPAIIVRTSRKCGISRNTIAASRSTHVAIRRPTLPKDGERYSQERARDDIRSVLDALKIDKAHITGVSMGGFAALHFGFTYPDRCRSLVVAGCGYGAAPNERAKFASEAEASAKRFEDLTMAKAAEGYALGPTRVQHQNKDPRGWREFADQFAEHSTEGAALTMRGVRSAAHRCSIWSTR